MQSKASTSQLVRLAIVFSFGLVACTQVIGDDKHHGKHNKHSNKHHSGHGHGFTGISLSPAGIGITLQNQNFGIDIAPGTLRNVRQQIAGVPPYQTPDLAAPGMVVPTRSEPLIVSPPRNRGIEAANSRWPRK